MPEGKCCAGAGGDVCRWLGTGAGASQSPSQSPIDAEGGFLANQGAQPRFESGTKISGQAELALRAQRVLSIPHFTGSFAFNGQTFPFNVVGTQPQAGGITRIPTQLKPVTLLFEGYEDDQGEPIVLSPEPLVLSVRNSPNFRSAQYQTGFTQFADAVQRAQFYSAMAQRLAYAPGPSASPEAPDHGGAKEFSQGVPQSQHRRCVCGGRYGVLCLTAEYAGADGEFAD